MNQVKWKVEYQIACYSGTVYVWADPDADRDEIIAEAKRDLSRNAALPFGSEGFRVSRCDQ